jgi:hypothetical protein
MTPLEEDLRRRFGKMIDGGVYKLLTPPPHLSRDPYDLKRMDWENQHVIGDARSRLYQSDSGKLTLVLQSYRIGLHMIKEIVEFCEKHELDVNIDGVNVDGWTQPRCVLITIQKRSDSTKNSWVAGMKS